MDIPTHSLNSPILKNIHLRVCHRDHHNHNHNHSSISQETCSTRTLNIINSTINNLHSHHNNNSSSSRDNKLTLWQELTKRLHVDCSRMHKFVRRGRSFFSHMSFSSPLFFPLSLTLYTFLHSTRNCIQQGNFFLDEGEGGKSSSNSNKQQQRQSQKILECELPLLAV